MKWASLRGQEFGRSRDSRRTGCGIGYLGKWAEVVGFEWRGSVSLLEGEKFMRERRWALAVKRDRADVKWARSEEEEENGEEDNDSNSDES
jgi:hypothetical protein